MPLQATSGAASYDAFGGGVPVVPAYIEDVFSTYLYTGSNSATTITNGIDLSTKGGMIWIKSRGVETDHYVVDSQRIDGSGDFGMLGTNSTSAQSFQAGVSSFNSNGFSLDGNVTQANRSGYGPYVSWTFRKQPKFFDVVTWTGDGAGSRNISHSLGSTPGMVIVKRTDSTGYWAVWNTSVGSFPPSLLLNTDAARGTATTYVNGYILATSATNFSVEEGTTKSAVNESGGTYVAYLFANDAGGFGATGTDNAISCGVLTSNGSGDATVTLGYEPQWLMWKIANGTEQWNIQDTLRGFTSAGATDKRIFPNLTNAEQTGDYFHPTSTGFTSTSGLLQSSKVYVYVAIRKGPMR